MSQTWIISGPPGCGKTSWILNTFKNHSGNCGYVRLGGYSEINLEQAINSKIDFAFLKDQIPNLLDLSSSKLPLEVEKENILIIIEFPQFFIPKFQGISGIDLRVIKELEIYNLQPNKYLHFGRDLELPIKDTLDFKAIESCSIDLNKNIWDPASLNTFKNYSGNCGYLRLGGYSEINLEQAINSKIDFAFLKDQIPNLLDLSSSKSVSYTHLTLPTIYSV